MFSAFKRIGAWIRDLSPSTIREIIVIVVILVISVLLSIPQFKEDMEELRIWEEAQNSTEAVQHAK
jgi:hypothetical protein